LIFTSFLALVKNKGGSYINTIVVGKYYYLLNVITYLSFPFSQPHFLSGGNKKREIIRRLPPFMEE
jgi:hypothetical protein